MRLALPFLAALCLAACAALPAPVPAPATAVVARAGTVTVGERFLTQELPGDELDSLATWPTEDGAVWLIASAKNVHQLLVFDADSGEMLRRGGARGDGAAEFLRPSGEFVPRAPLAGSERHKRRHQDLELPA